jgi:integrase
MKLTLNTLSKIDTGGKADFIAWDDDLPGFGLRIREGGSRNWVVQYKIGQQNRRMTIGSTKVHPNPDDARKVARKILSRVGLGEDPQADKAEAERATGDTFAAIVDRYLEVKREEIEAGAFRESSYEGTELYLRRGYHTKPLHDMAIDKIALKDVALALDAVKKRSGPTTALRVRSNLSSLFAYAIGMGLRDDNPVINTLKPAVPNGGKRDRVLSEEELAAIWRNLPEDHDFGRIIKLLILTGCRADEIGALEWSEVNGDQINLPPQRTKNGHAHTVHLSKLALEQLPERREGRALVFGSGRGGFQGYSKCKDALDAKLRFNTSWRIHDLRRSVATHMAEIGVLPHIVEATLNHLSGHKSGIAGVYNRATYDEERAAALDKWAGHVRHILAQTHWKKAREVRAAS